MNSIIDVSSVIYGGHAGMSGNRVRGFPVGGLRKLFGIINAGLSSSDFALCFDGGNIIKKELLPTYKAGRVPDYSVLAQVDLAKELLANCGIDFYFDPQYEADDFVYSLCRELSLLNSTEETVIYTDDRDLACCITDCNSIRNVTSNGICLSMTNYVERVVRGQNTPYNTILLWKTFHGDNSDNYKSLNILGLTYELLAKDFVEAIDPLIADGSATQMFYADYDVFTVLVKRYESIISASDRELLLRQARIAYPYKVTVSDVDIQQYATELRTGEPLFSLVRKHTKFFGNGDFDRQKFEFYCFMLGLTKARGVRFVDRDSAEAQEFYSLLEMRATELSNGTLAVKYHQRKHQQRGEGTIANMSLPI